MEQTIQVGDILAGTWGYSMRIPCFYRVVGLTEKRAKVVELGHKMVRSTDGGYFQQGYEMPDDSRLESRVQLARPYKDAWLVGSKYNERYLCKWDGSPIWADYMD